MHPRLPTIPFFDIQLGASGDTLHFYFENESEANVFIVELSDAELGKIRLSNGREYSYVLPEKGQLIQAVNIHGKIYYRVKMHKETYHSFLPGEMNLGAEQIHPSGKLIFSDKDSAEKALLQLKAMKAIIVASRQGEMIQSENGKWVIQSDSRALNKVKVAQIYFLNTLTLDAILDVQIQSANIIEQQVKPLINRLKTGESKTADLMSQIIAIPDTEMSFERKLRSIIGIMKDRQEGLVGLMRSLKRGEKSEQFLEALQKLNLEGQLLTKRKEALQKYPNPILNKPATTTNFLLTNQSPVNPLITMPFVQPLNHGTSPSLTTAPVTPVLSTGFVMPSPQTQPQPQLMPPPVKFTETSRSIESDDNESYDYEDKYDFIPPNSNTHSNLPQPPAVDEPQFSDFQDSPSTSPVSTNLSEQDKPPTTSALRDQIKKLEKEIEDLEKNQQDNIDVVSGKFSALKEDIQKAQLELDTLETKKKELSQLENQFSQLSIAGLMSRGFYGAAPQAQPGAPSSSYFSLPGFNKN